VGELASAIDLPAADDLPGLPAPALLDRLAGLLREHNRMAAEIARTVRACETAGAAEFDGLKSMASWLRGHAHLSHREAREVVATGRALEHLPATAAAFADGQLTAGQAGLIAQVATPARLAQAAAANVDLAVIDAALAAVAVGEGYDKLVAVVRYYRKALDPDGPEPDPTEGRRLSLARHLDGTRGLSGQLDAMGGEKLQAALESLVQAGRRKGDTRTPRGPAAGARRELASGGGQSGPSTAHLPHREATCRGHHQPRRPHRHHRQPRRRPHRVRRRLVRRPGPPGRLRRPDPPAHPRPRRAPPRRRPGEAGRPPTHPPRRRTP
jgi:hypothetical protein